jgi:hypothetical protein
MTAALLLVALLGTAAPPGGAAVPDDAAEAVRLASTRTRWPASARSPHATRVMSSPASG